MNMKTVQINKQLQVFLCSKIPNRNDSLKHGWGRRYLREDIKNFLKRRNFRKVIELYQKKFKARGIIMLFAHAGNRNGIYSYYDRGKVIPVQDWIDAHDGDAAVLMLYCCNEGNQEISSQKSLVVHPDQYLNGVKLWARKGITRMYVPGHGYIDKSYYRMRKVLQELQK